MNPMRIAMQVVSNMRQFVRVGNNTNSLYVPILHFDCQYRNGTLVGTNDERWLKIDFCKLHPGIFR